jgi:hypothetical protein
MVRGQPCIVQNFPHVSPIPRAWRLNSMHTRCTRYLGTAVTLRNDIHDEIQTVWDFLFRWLSSGLWYHVVWLMGTNVSREHATYKASLSLIWRKHFHPRWWDQVTGLCGDITQKVQSKMRARSIQTIRAAVELRIFLLFVPCLKA